MTEFRKQTNKKHQTSGLNNFIITSINIISINQNNCPNEQLIIKQGKTVPM